MMVGIDESKYNKNRNQSSLVTQTADSRCDRTERIQSEFTSYKHDQDIESLVIIKKREKSINKNLNLTAAELKSKNSENERNKIDLRLTMTAQELLEHSQHKQL